MKTVNDRVEEAHAIFTDVLCRQSMEILGSDPDDRWRHRVVSPEPEDRFAKLLLSVSGRSSASVTVAAVKDSRDNESMETSINRPELDAKLETIEARMDGRIARIEDRFDRMERTIGDIKTMMHAQRKTIWGAAITTVTLVLAAMGLFITSFDSGRDTAKMAAQAQQETAAALTQMQQIVSDLKATQPPQK